MKTQMTERIPILTIAIPTFNRSHYLRQCLEALLPQVVASASEVRVLVLNNNSSDDTTKVAEELLVRFPQCLMLINNPENIGGDANIAKCFSEIHTQYGWIFGDDDVLVPGALDVILGYLRVCEYGVVHIRSYSYEGDALKVRTVPKGRYEEFKADNVEGMLYEVADMFSFISGNIFNKSLVPADINPYEFIWTRYNQVQWVFGALFSGCSNLLIDDALLAVNNEGNSGGYPFCKIFGTNYNLFFDQYERRGIPRRYFDIINRRMARELFTPLIYFARTVENFRNYTPEDYFAELKPNFGRYWEFWVFVAPMCKLPKPLLFPHFFIIRLLNRLYRLVR
jgi:abequosyltransferase